MDSSCNKGEPTASPVEQIEGDGGAGALRHVLVERGVGLVAHAEEGDHLEAGERLLVEAEVGADAEDGDEEDEEGLHHLHLLLG